MCHHLIALIKQNIRKHKKKQQLLPFHVAYSFLIYHALEIFFFPHRSVYQWESEWNPLRTPSVHIDYFFHIYKKNRLKKIRLVENLKDLMFRLKLSLKYYLYKIPANFYLFKVNYRNTRKRCEICSKLTIKTLEQRRWRRSSVLIVNFEHISPTKLNWTSIKGLYDA